MPQRYFLGGLLALALLTACRKDNFEPDPANKLLPAYSETGRNTGGAMINDLAWRTYTSKTLFSRRTALVVEAQEDTVFVVFDGDMQGKAGTTADPAEAFAFALRRTGRTPFTLDSLLNLHNRRFVLDGRRNRAEMDYLGRFSGYGAGRGELHVRRVQKKVTPNSAGNGQPFTEYTLSGTFRFTAYRRTDSVQVTEGRFDHRISQLGY